MRELEQWPEEHCILRPFVEQENPVEERPEEVNYREGQQKQEDIHHNQGLLGHCPEVRSLHREHRMLLS